MIMIIFNFIQKYIVYIILIIFSLINIIVFGDGTSQNSSLLFFKQLLHTEIISTLNQDDIKIIIGKDNFSKYLPFLGIIMDFRFYFEVIIKIF